MSLMTEVSETTTTSTHETQFCTFKLGDMLFGIEVAYVQEVLLKQAITRMPLTPPVVAGLINLRGQIVTAIDLRLRLNLEPHENSEEMNVVVRTHETAYSLIVDDIGDIVTVDEADFEAPPETLTGAARELITGAFKLNGVLLLVFDVEKAAEISLETEV